MRGVTARAPYEEMKYESSCCPRIWRSRSVRPSKASSLEESHSLSCRATTWESIPRRRSWRALVFFAIWLVPFPDFQFCTVLTVTFKATSQLGLAQLQTLSRLYQIERTCLFSLPETIPHICAVHTPIYSPHSRPPRRLLRVSLFLIEGDAIY